MHFNNLTPAQAERLAILSEECGEVIQAVGKILRHGYNSTHPNGGPNNRSLLEKELGDLQHAIHMMVDNDLDMVEINKVSYVKSKAIAPYLHHQGE